MTLMHLGIRSAVLLGLTAVFLVTVFNGLARDTRQASAPQNRDTPAATPSPTAPVLPTPTLNTTPPPPQDQLCHRAGPSPALTEVEISGAPGQVIARAYCSGTVLKYVTYVDQGGVVERTYLFQGGVVRVKLYHADGDVIKREDFDQEGNLVPDGTYFTLPNSRIGP